MSYVANSLTAQERVVHQARIHWVSYVWGVFIFLAGIALINRTDDASQFFGALMLPVGLISLPVTWIRIKTTEFAVTNLRVLTKRGLIRRTTSEMLLKKVESVDVKQGVLGRVLDYGTVTMTGSGGSHDPFRQIAAPLALRKAVQTAIQQLEEASRSATSAIADNSQPSDIADQIRKIRGLHADGLLTDKEFEDKKRELLSRM